MYLHENRRVFNEIMTSAVENQDRLKVIVEKDYYVFMTLKLIKEYMETVRPGEVSFLFKGGTSLSKAFHVIDRFSEDIDLTMPAERHKTDTLRKRLVEAVLWAYKELGIHLEEGGRPIERTGRFNSIIGYYDTDIPRDGTGVEAFIKCETAHLTPTYPYEERPVISYAATEVLRIYGPEAVKEYELAAITIPTVSMIRTFVDKVFAVADYYLEGKTNRYSRHIYDLYKLINYYNWDTKQIDEFVALLIDVKEKRSKNPRCKSTSPGVDTRAEFINAITSDAFKADYENKTQGILFENVTYEQCKQTILKFIEYTKF